MLHPSMLSFLVLECIFYSLFFIFALFATLLRPDWWKEDVEEHWRDNAHEEV